MSVAVARDAGVAAAVRAERLAATLGAKIVEAHFMLRDEPSEIEANVSLDEYQFAEMVTKVRQIEGMMA